MINLKLAEYKDGKFEKFLELGKDFGYCGGYVDLFDYAECSKGDLITGEKFIKDYYSKDPKDPLNRFNGLFNGRTYGEGRFVLIQDTYCDHICDMTNFDINSGADLLPVRKIGIQSSLTLPAVLMLAEDLSFRVRRYSVGADPLGNSPLGNLHENPELWSKIDKLEDAELNNIANSREGQKRIRVNINDL